MYYELFDHDTSYFNVTDTFCQFCGIYGINDLESRLQLRSLIFAPVEGEYNFLLFLNSNLGPILPRFRDIRAFVRRKPLFRYPSPIPVKISGCSPWSRYVVFGSAKSGHLKLTDGEIILEE